MNIKIGDTLVTNNRLYDEGREHEVIAIDKERMEYICVDENNPYSTVSFTKEYLDEFLIKNKGVTR